MIDLRPTASPLAQALSPVLASLPAPPGTVLALDPAALADAVDRDAPTRVAYLSSLDRDWQDVLPHAHAVLLAHPALLEGAVALGAPRARVRVAAVIALGAPRDRALARSELALPPDAPIVVVPTSVIGDDPSAFLLQLAVARPEIRFLFDVGRDAAAARALRAHVSFPAYLFAEGPTAELAWAAADRALVRIDRPELARALAAGAAPILAAPRAIELSAARALAREHLATIAASDVTLAIAIDEACRPAEIEAARAALAGLEVGTGAARLGEALRTALEELRRARPDDLPIGLEPIGPRPGDAPPDAKRLTSDEEIESELAALRERIRSG